MYLLSLIEFHTQSYPFNADCNIYFIEEYVVCTGIGKDVGAPLQLYNPATKETETVDKHELANK